MDLLWASWFSVLPSRAVWLCNNNDMNIRVYYYLKRKSCQQKNQPAHIPIGRLFPKKALRVGEGGNSLGIFYKRVYRNNIQVSNIKNKMYGKRGMSRQGVNYHSFWKIIQKGLAFQCEGIDFLWGSVQGGTCIDLIINHWVCLLLLENSKMAKVLQLSLDGLKRQTGLIHNFSLIKRLLRMIQKQAYDPGSGCGPKKSNQHFFGLLSVLQSHQSCVSVD